MESLFWCRSAPAASAYKQVRAKWCLCRNVVVNHSYGWGEASEKCSRLVIIQLFFPPPPSCQVVAELGRSLVFPRAAGASPAGRSSVCLDLDVGPERDGGGGRRQRWWWQQTGVQTATGGGNNEPGTHQTASACSLIWFRLESAARTLLQEETLCQQEHAADGEENKAPFFGLNPAVFS